MAESNFAGDPLLLRRASQQSYGRTLLRNLLIGRTMATGLPDPVELHDCDADALEVRQIYDPPAPAVDLEARYRKKRIERRALGESDFNALATLTMTAKPELTARRLRDQPEEGEPRKLRFLTNAEANDELSEHDIKLDQRLRIAAVGFRVKISKLVAKGYFKEDLCILGQLPPDPEAIGGLVEAAGFSQLGRTTLMPTGDHDRWNKTICGHIGKAVSSGSHIVVVPEFALPPGKEDFALEESLRDCCTAGTLNDHFVFAGSRHEGGTNRGMLFHLKNKALQGHTHWHYKVASARSLGENVLGPHSDKYPSYVAEITVGGETNKFNLTVAICYDSFDPSTFLSLVLHNAHGENYFRNRIILVPSFNPSSQFVDFLRDLSFLTLCPVVYVNSLHGDARMFIAGFAMSDILNESGKHLLDSLKAMIAEVQKQHEAEQSAAREFLAQAKRAKSEAALRRAKPWAKREEALLALHATFEALERGGGLKHLITVERCEYCATNSHDDDYECGTDILYYNIDMRLLKALSTFRSHYFRADESFIPEPFRRRPLARAARKMMDRMDRWNQQVAPHMKAPHQA